MSRKPFRAAPAVSPTMPTGIPYIVANEAAERFSFYGMRGILVIFMTQYLVNRQGQPVPMSDVQAREYYHLFAASVYFCPFLGALLSDVVLGKYRTIIYLSLVYCLGHLALAIDDTRLGLAVGLALVALGSGGVKPCVTAHVGDQFGKSNQHLLSKVFAWFYLAINLGSAFALYLTPLFLDRYGPKVAFAVPGILMALATFVFWLGRHKFVHIPPGGIRFLKEALSREGLGALFKLSGIYVFVAMFWALYDQTGSSWVLQAEHLNRRWLGMDWLSSQIQVINPILILTFIPLFTYVVYPAVDRVFLLTPLRKVSIGLFLMAGAFVIPSWLEMRIAAGETPSIAWQVLAYVPLTASEVMVSVTCIEFSYTQAPRTMKSFVMALFFLSISAGNLFTSLVNTFIQNPDGTTRLEGAAYFWFFTTLMAITAVLFIAVAAVYKERTYIQEESHTTATT